jgi:hypothetical protein
MMLGNAAWRSSVGGESGEEKESGDFASWRRVSRV